MFAPCQAFQISQSSNNLPNVPLAIPATIQFVPPVPPTPNYEKYIKTIYEFITKIDKTKINVYNLFNFNVEFNKMENDFNELFKAFQTYSFSTYTEIKKILKNINVIFNNNKNIIVKLYLLKLYFNIIDDLSNNVGSVAGYAAQEDEEQNIKDDVKAELTRPLTDEFFKNVGKMLNVFKNDCFNNGFYFNLLDFYNTLKNTKYDFDIFEVNKTLTIYIEILLINNKFNKEFKNLTLINEIVNNVFETVNNWVFSYGGQLKNILDDLGAECEFLINNLAFNPDEYEEEEQEEAEEQFNNYIGHLYGLNNYIDKILKYGEYITPDEVKENGIINEIWENDYSNDEQSEELINLIFCLKRGVLSYLFKLD